MLQLAAKLPPWQGNNGTATLARSDAGVVLQEYLRVYECSLSERRFFLFSEILREQIARATRGDLFDFTRLAGIGDIVFQKAPKEERQIAYELATIRSTINRTVGLVLGLERFSQLDDEITCLERASLDIRNGIGLAAEAASQLPRVLNVRDSLRDFNQP